ncbi:DUF2690 domain-containing protein [Pimelobacter simplex]|uniref:DUF2690 domain-containing protein n=1 Tax=Nocardioides simplex TaxID=2045 RepID=UPI003AACBD57
MRLLVLAATLAAALSFTTAPIAGPASASPAPRSAAAAAPSCTWTACTGRDPSAQGCEADARTVSSFSARWRSNVTAPAHVEVRHSNACHARWLRITAPSGNFGCGGGADGEVRLRDRNSSGTVIATVLKRFGGCGARQAIWTAMIGRSAASSNVRYCFREVDLAWNSSPDYAPCKNANWP